MLGCKNIDIRKFYEAKGSLCVIDTPLDIDFNIKRIFYIFDVADNEIRGKHANVKSSFVMIAVKGSCKILLDNGAEKNTFVLNSPNRGLWIDNLTWKEMYNFSNDCVLIVLSNQEYDKMEYIYDYKEFIDIIKEQHR